jgi:hypothetical protein
MDIIPDYRRQSLTECYDAFESVIDNIANYFEYDEVDVAPIVRNAEMAHLRLGLWLYDSGFTDQPDDRLDSASIPQIEPSDYGDDDDPVDRALDEYFSALMLMHKTMGKLARVYEPHLKLVFDDEEQGLRLLNHQAIQAHSRYLKCREARLQPVE